MRPIVALFLFTLRQTLLSRKIWLTLLLLSAPCALLLIIRCFDPPDKNARELWEMYHVLGQFFLVVLYSSSLRTSDIDRRTDTSE